MKLESYLGYFQLKLTILWLSFIFLYLNNRATEKKRSNKRDRQGYSAPGYTQMATTAGAGPDQSQAGDRSSIHVSHTDVRAQAFGPSPLLHQAHQYRAELELIEEAGIAGSSLMHYTKTLTLKTQSFSSHADAVKLYWDAGIQENLHRRLFLSLFNFQMFLHHSLS